MGTNNCKTCLRTSVFVLIVFLMLFLSSCGRNGLNSDLVTNLSDSIGRAGAGIYGVDFGIDRLLANNSEVGHMDASDVKYAMTQTGLDQLLGQSTKSVPQAMATNMAYQVVCWSESSSPGGNGELKFRIQYHGDLPGGWEDASSAPISVSNPTGSNLQYPAVTAEIYWGYAPLEFTHLTVHIVYEKIDSNGSSVICYQQYENHDLDGMNIASTLTLFNNSVPEMELYSFPPEGMGQILNYRHPDIVFTAIGEDEPHYQGSGGKTLRGTLFITFEVQAELGYELFLGHMDITDPNNPAWLQDPFFFHLARWDGSAVDVEGFTHIPQFPRIDAGIDFTLPENEVPRFVGIVTWHELKRNGPDYDFDWRMQAFDLTKLPDGFIMPIYGEPGYEPQNDSDTWMLFPYIDIDHINKWCGKPLAHYVVTSSTNNGGHFSVQYSNSTMLSVFQNPMQTATVFDEIGGRDAGLASLAMYPSQSILNCPETSTLADYPDFLVAFLIESSLPDPAVDVMATRGYFTDPFLSNHPSFHPVETISDPGNEGSIANYPQSQPIAVSWEWLDTCVYWISDKETSDSVLWDLSLGNTN